MRFLWRTTTLEIKMTEFYFQNLKKDKSQVFH